jgi:Fe2+ or Zn2+ uptake regulation protein
MVCHRLNSLHTKRHRIDFSSEPFLQWLIAKTGRKGVVMTHHTIDYQSIIRSAGHRVTPQRIIILDSVCAAGGHTTLGEVYARARQLDSEIDRSTIYRALKLFVELGLVVSADTGDGEVYYEIARQNPHHHLVCRECGTEQEIEHALLQGLFEQVYSEYNFKVDTDHIVLFGLCENCRRKESA